MKEDAFNDFPWVLPWQKISANGREAYEAELRTEAGPGHPLYEVEFTAIARTCHTDDVLFQLNGHEAEFAVVHLTYVGRQESSAKWPAVILFRDIDHWILRGMLRDAAIFEDDWSDRAA